MVVTLILLMMVIMSIDNDSDSGTLQDTKHERLKKRSAFWHVERTAVYIPLP